MSSGKNDMEMHVDTPGVVVKHVSKRYDTSGLKRVVQGSKQKKLTLDALKDVNFVVSHGESIGVLGHNGSGKSTLLRLIAGSENPTSGEILTSTKPSLLGIGAALQPRLSGEKNIKLGLLAAGMDPRRINDAIEEIMEFTDLGDAIYRPMETYSSGMGARLRFAISTTMRPKILLIDEALSTGDATFTSKAERMKRMLDNSGTVFLVSHAPSVIQSMCTRALWLHGGELIADGDVKEIGDGYSSWAHREALGQDEWGAQIINDFRSSYIRPEIDYFTKEVHRVEDNKSDDPAAPPSAPRGMFT